MSLELGFAAGIGILTFSTIIYSGWVRMNAYEYPFEIQGNVLREFEYSAKHRILWLRLIAYLTIVPLLAFAVAYIFAVGFTEVVF